MLRKTFVTIVVAAGIVLATSAFAFAQSDPNTTQTTEVTAAAQHEPF